MRGVKAAVLGAVVLAGLGCPDPAKGKPKATVAEPVAKPAQAVAPLAGAARYAIDAASSKVLFVGAKVTGKHEGGFTDVTGAVEVVEGDPTKSRVQATVGMASLFTDSPKLTGHLKSDDFFSVDRLPQATFVSTKLVRREDGRFDVTGDFTLHGVTKSLTFPATITVGDAAVDATAEFALNRKDFGVLYPGKPDDLIADDVALKLQVHATKG